MKIPTYDATLLERKILNAKLLRLMILKFSYRGESLIVLEFLVVHKSYVNCPQFIEQCHEHTQFLTEYITIIYLFLIVTISR